MNTVDYEWDEYEPCQQDERRYGFERMDSLFDSHGRSKAADMADAGFSREWIRQTLGGINA